MSASDRLGETARTPGFGLGARIVLLVVSALMLAEVAFYVPSIAAFRQSWLDDRLAAARAAALMFEAVPAGTKLDEIASDLLASIGARSIALKKKDTRRLLASVDMPQAVDDSFDQRKTSEFESIRAAFQTLAAPDGRVIGVVGPAREGSEFIELTLDETPLRQAMFDYSRNILLMSMAISALVGALALFALNVMVLRPVRRLSSNIMAFGADPQNAHLIIEPSGSAHEIGRTEDALATMQRSLAGELGRTRNLAALGLAVAKINHDLRNILSTAQLLSDRLSALSDPLGRSIAPRLVATLDRAIAYCQSTLNYGRAAEPAPRFERVRLHAVVDEAVATAAPHGGDRITMLNETPNDIELRADPEQLFRILLNLLRNAVDVLDQAGPRPGGGAVVRVRARQEAGSVVILVEDSGPGVPERMRENLFKAFQTSMLHGGFGLGLVIAADLARAHGGSIALLDTPAEGLGGAAFRILLPARAASAPSARPRAANDAR